MRTHRQFCPKAGLYLLELFLSPGHDSLIGDIEEEFCDDAAYRGLIRARVRFWSRIVKTIPFVLLHDLIWENRMIKNYILVAARNIRRFKGFSAINILGLALSMSLSLLIISFVMDQGSFDSFHENAERIFRITSRGEHPTGNYHMATSPAPLGLELVRQHPGVEDVVRMRKMGGQLTYEGRFAALRGVYADPSFFDFFDFDLEQGDPLTSLINPFGIVLTGETAEMLFGTVNPIGRIVHLRAAGDFEVTGVLAPMSSKTHLKVDAIASFSTLTTFQPDEVRWSLDSWTNNSGFYNYVILAPGTSIEDLEAVSVAMAAPYYRDDRYPVPEYIFQNVADISLGIDLSNQITSIMSNRSAYVFSFMAVILMLTAIFNYISLSVARSLNRAKEIGIRKVVGAHRGQIVKQLISESIVISLIALVVAIILFFALVPQFNALSFISKKGSEMSVEVLADPQLYLYFLLFAVSVGFIAGLYPALRMSTYKPVQVLKGLSRIGGFRRLTLRKTLIVFQFSITIIAVLTTIVIFKQTSYILTGDYGFDQDQLLQIDLRGVSYPTLREELMRIPGVSEVAGVSSILSGGSTTQTDVQTGEMDKPVLIQHLVVDEHFVDQFSVDLVAGRFFSDERITDGGRALVITESAVSFLGLGGPLDAVGVQLKFDAYTSAEPYDIIGVVGDLYTQGFEDGYVPVAMTLNQASLRFAVVRIDPIRVEETLEAISAVWNKLSPSIPLSYAFFDDALKAGYSNFQDMIRLTGLFSGMILFIACLGLLGMASYSTETRIKEIGIRKVLGADSRSVLTLLSREYITLVAVAIVIATPLAYLLLDTVLQIFANRITIGVGILLVGIVPIIMLALLTIGSQTLRAAYADPANTIRNE